MLNLPDTPQTRQSFSLQNNQHGDCVQGQLSVCYDVLNDVGLSLAFDKKSSEPGYVKAIHHQELQRGDTLVFDRGYGDYLMLAQLVKEGYDFILRLGRQTFDVGQLFLKSDRQETIVVIPVPAHRQKAVLRARITDKPKATSRQDSLRQR